MMIKGKFFKISARLVQDITSSCTLTLTFIEMEKKIAQIENSFTEWLRERPYYIIKQLSIFRLLRSLIYIECQWSFYMGSHGN